MYVLLNLEWLAIDRRHYSPTQLAALRVNESWYVTDQFFTLFRPHKQFSGNWTHTAFSGYEQREFLSAPHAYSALESFERWLAPDDILCCWQDEAPTVLKTLFPVLLKRNLPQKLIPLKPYFAAYVRDGRAKYGNLLEIAKARGLRPPSHEHDAAKDVRVVRSILKDAALDQSKLAWPVSPRPVQPPQTFSAFYDHNTGLVHLAHCPSVRSYSALQGFAKLSTCVAKNYLPCPECCAEAWNHALIERNADIVRRTGCHYFFFTKSRLFHLGSCQEILQAKTTFHPAAKYDTCIDAGKSPCPVCKPVPGLSAQLTSKEKQAYQRYTQARKERDQKKDIPLHGAELSDMITLTSTRYAFFASSGYSSFHQRTCPKLQEAHEVIGFARYTDAIFAGYHPCRICKPTKKADVHVSIPIHNRIRENEHLEDVLALCKTLNLKYTCKEPLLEIKTAVSKWRIYTASRPVIVDHMPLHSDNGRTPVYHRQHRIFLSLEDTLRYIQKHDKT